MWSSIKDLVALRGGLSTLSQDSPGGTRNGLRGLFQISFQNMELHIFLHMVCFYFLAYLF